MITPSGVFNGENKMIKQNNFNLYSNLTIHSLKEAEELIAKTADWFQSQVEEFEKEAKILDSPNCTEEESQRIYNKSLWFQKRREFELDQLEKYTKAKERILMANFMSGIHTLKF